MQEILDFIWNNFPIFAAILIAALSEAFALIPAMKSNSILQLIYNLLTKVTAKK